MSDPILSIITNTRAMTLLKKHKFDIGKYANTSLGFFYKEFVGFMIDLNRKHKVFENDDFVHDMDYTSFCTPWMIDFLEKCLDKRAKQDTIAKKTVEEA